MNNGGGGNGTTGYFEISVWADTTQFTKMRVEGLGKCGYLVIGDREIFVEDKT